MDSLPLGQVAEIHHKPYSTSACIGQAGKHQRRTLTTQVSSFFKGIIEALLWDGVFDHLKLCKELPLLPLFQDSPVFVSHRAEGLCPG